MGDRVSYPYRYDPSLSLAERREIYFDCLGQFQQEVAESVRHGSFPSWTPADCTPILWPSSSGSVRYHHSSPYTRFAASVTAVTGSQVSIERGSFNIGFANEGSPILQNENESGCHSDAILKQNGNSISITDDDDGCGNGPSASLTLNSKGGVFLNHGGGVITLEAQNLFDHFSEVEITVKGGVLQDDSGKFVKQGGWGSPKAVYRSAGGEAKPKLTIVLQGGAVFIRN